MILTHWSRVQFLAFPQIYFDVAEIHRRRWLEESGERFDSVDLVLAKKVVYKADPSCDSVKPSNGENKKSRILTVVSSSAFQSSFSFVVFQVSEVIQKMRKKNLLGNVPEKKLCKISFAANLRFKV